MAQVVTIDTSMGPISFELYANEAPRTCKNFEELCGRGYYNGTLFHRVIKNFMVQGGDPTGTGKGGQSIYGSKFEDEITPTLKHTGAGILSMANAGPNTNGSQFFVTLAPTPWLDGKHTIFGRVCAGMGVLKKMNNVPTNANDRPLNEVKILRAYKGEAREGGGHNMLEGFGGFKTNAQRAAGGRSGGSSIMDMVR